MEEWRKTSTLAPDGDEWSGSHPGCFTPGEKSNARQRQEDFSSSLCVQTSSGTHPPSCTMGIGGPFPGAKRGRGMTLTTHPHLVPRSRMIRSLPPFPTERECSNTIYSMYRNNQKSNLTRNTSSMGGVSCCPIPSSGQ
jgi:hypothetical protein